MMRSSNQWRQMLMNNSKTIQTRRCSAPSAKPGRAICRHFEQLVAHHQKRILADCRFLTRDENNSEDLAQEVFVRAFFGLRTFEGRSSFRHWLQRIKVHHCLNHIKKREGKQVLSIDEETVEEYEQLHVPALAQQDVEAQGNRQRIGAILNEMPATLRIPLIMCDMDELSYEEIAASLHIGLSAVRITSAPVINSGGASRAKQIFPGAGTTMNPENNASPDRPLRVLVNQEQDPSPDFIGKVRRRIYRRTTASQFASYSWHLPKVVLMEMARLVGHLVVVLREQTRSRSGER